MRPAHPASDRTARELAALYRTTRTRLERLVRAALERGAQGTSEFYAAQHRAVVEILAQLQRQAVPVAAGAVEAAYSLGVRATDSSLGSPRIAFSSLVHQDALEVLADNLANRLNDAAVTVGRRTDDAFRRIGLHETAIGLATGQTMPQVADRLRQRILDEGVTDSLTGFVDKGGRRWQLDDYAEMATRTITREAVTEGTANRLLEAGRALVTITQHVGACKVCLPFEGRTYALTVEAAKETGYPLLENRPPFHPRCRHVMAPAAADFERFVSVLEADDQAAPIQSVVARTLETFVAQPFGPGPEPTTDAGTSGRLLEQEDAAQILRGLIDGDPGPGPDEEAARNAWLDGELKARDQARRRQGRDARARDKVALEALREQLGPDMVAALDDYAKSGLHWARDRDLLEALAKGEIDIDWIHDQAERELAAKEGRRQTRLRQEHARGFRTSRIPCFVCGRLKNRPADICDFCGDDPVTYGGDAQEFNRAYGFEN